MKHCYFLLVLTMLPWLSGCGSSPYENGKAFARSVISRTSSGNIAELEKLKGEVEEKAKGMSPADYANFMKGYTEVVQEQLKAKIPH